MILEPMTVTVMIGLLAVLCISFLLIVRLFFPKSVRGLNAWLIGSSLLMLGSLLHGWKEVNGSTVLILLANCFVIAGILLFWVGLQLFYQKPPLSRLVLLSLLGLVVVLISWFTWWHNSFQARLLAMAAVQTVLFASIVGYLLRTGSRGFGHRLIVCAYSLAAVISSVRLLTIIFVPEHLDTFFGVSVIHIAYLASFSVTWLLSTMGFIALIVEELQSKLVFLARHDVLTGVLNRGAFFAEAQEQFENARRHDQPLAVFLLDVDHFKRINDRYGHREGDRVLVTFSQCVRQSLGDNVLFGRYGGEEFVALLVGSDKQRVLNKAEHVRESVRQGLSEWGVTVSLGVAMDRQAGNIDELLAQADEALYDAKNRGRDQVVLAAALVA